jgi:3D (Asp-Asp-Asp) domain-containing protein
MGLPLQAKGTGPALTQPAPATSPKGSAKASTAATLMVKTHAANPSKMEEAKLVASTASSTAPHAKSSLVETKLSAASPSLSATNHAKSTLTLAKTSEKQTASIPSILTSKSHKDTSARLASQPASGGRLARVTAYWASEGDYYTRHGISSTGIRLHDGLCAVDPRIIPYGSVVDIAGIGKYLAVDTGSAVISREAAREAAHTSSERNALVIDLYFESRADGENFASTAPKYASISWWTPGSTGHDAKAARDLFADENWSKIQNKPL